MQMIEVKVSELIGPALDWAVANAIGADIEIKANYVEINHLVDRPDGSRSRVWEPFKPSTNWSQGGPLIHKYEIIFFRTQYLKGRGRGKFLSATIGFAQTVSKENAKQWADIGSGFPHLIAACRAIVEAKLGDTVQVPADLVEAA